MTVKEIIRIIGEAKEIRIAYEGNTYQFNPYDGVMLEAYGKFVVERVYAMGQDVFEIDLMLRPVIGGTTE